MIAAEEGLEEVRLCLTAGDEAPNGARNLRKAQPKGKEGLEEVQQEPTRHSKATIAAPTCKHPFTRRCNRHSIL